MPTAPPPGPTPRPNSAESSRSFARQVGGWTLVERLGRGAFGQTWLARAASGARAAVKLLKRPPGDDVASLARVAHPAIVSVLDAGSGPVPYLAMELAPGRSLAEIMPVDENSSLKIVGSLFDALAVLHRVGLTHGDVKPDNVMVDADLDGMNVKLIDFGVAGLGRAGTLAWASPERAAGRADPARRRRLRRGIGSVDPVARGASVWRTVERADAAPSA